jgi:hypothetical protein
VLVRALCVEGHVLSALVGVWNEGSSVLEPGTGVEAAFLSNAQVLAYSMLEECCIVYEGEVSIETAVLKGRDLYLGFWVDGKHYSRIVRNALDGVTPGGVTPVGVTPVKEAK